MQCELVDGGQLLEAARLKKDHNILHHIENRDCVAIEVKYHASCHREYTRFLSREEPTRGQMEQLYAQSCEEFCKYAIDGRIIRDKEIFRLTKLKKMFDKAVIDIEGKDSSGYKTWNLKKRLTKRYPVASTREFVYVDNLSTDKLIEDSTRLQESTIGSETDSTDTDDTADSISQKEHPPQRSAPVPDGNKKESMHVPILSTLRDRFATALDIKQEIANVSTSTLPWPPTASDLNLDIARRIIPPKLFNFIAWIVSASEDPTDDEFVQVTEVESRRILAIAQDVVFLASKGKKGYAKTHLISYGSQTSVWISTTHRTSQWFRLQCVPLICTGT